MRLDPFPEDSSHYANVKTKIQARQISVCHLNPYLRIGKSTKRR